MTRAVSGGVVAATTRHLPQLDGVRGLSAVLVVITHAPKLGLTPLLPGDISSYAVMAFFALSGFLMGHLYLHKPFDAASSAHYASARVSRIVPLYYLVVIASWVIYNFIDPSFFYAMTTAALPAHLLFFGSVSYFWSIGPEVQFYAVFLLLWWGVDRRRRGDPVPLIIFLVAAAFDFVFQPVFPGVTVFSKLPIFLGGVGVAILHQSLAARLQNSRLALAIQIAVLGLFILLCLGADYSGDLLYSATRDSKLNVYYGDWRRIMIALLVIFAFSFETRLGDALLANPLARALGRYSFSVYLLHAPVLWWLGALGLFTATGPALGFAIGLVVVYLAGWLSFRLIEMPAQAALRKPLTRRFDALARPFLRAPAR